jgi:apolipoprotein N-acyltransferase
MDLFYWLGVDFAAAAQSYGLATVLLILVAPVLIGGLLFMLAAIARDL